MEDAQSHLRRTARRLDLGRGEALMAIQKQLDRLYPGQTRTISLNDGVLKVATLSAAVASELRLRQVTLIKQWGEAIEFRYEINRLYIQIRTLD